MKITNEKYKHLNLANEDERGENLIIDFILSSIIGLLIAYLTFKNFFVAFLIYLFVRFIYYFCFEFFLERTPGKYQTQTKAVNIEGVKPTVFQIIKRNLCRFISVLSGISDDERAVHDTFSNTFVIKNIALKKIEIKMPLILIFKLLITSFWIYFIGIKSELNIIDIILLIALISIFIVNFISGIKAIKAARTPTKPLD